MYKTVQQFANYERLSFLPLENVYMKAINRKQKFILILAKKIKIQF